MSAAIPHILDLHQSRNHWTDFTAKVTFEDALMCVKDLHKSTEVPLLCIRAEFPALQLCLRNLDQILSRKGKRKSIDYVHTKLDGECVDELRHEHLDFSGQILRTCLSQSHNVTICKHASSLLLLQKINLNY